MLNIVDVYSCHIYTGLYLFVSSQLFGNVDDQILHIKRTQKPPVSW